MSMEELVVRLRIEEDNRMDLKKGGDAEPSKVHMMEACQTFKSNGKGAHKWKGKGKNLGPRQELSNEVQVLQLWSNRS